jgi:hypothetical protein
VDVEHTIREGVEQLLRDDAHEPREHDPLHVGGAEARDERAVVGLARGVIAVREHLGRHPSLGGTLERTHAGFVRDHDADLGVELARRDRREDRTEVAAAPRHQDSEPDRHALVLPDRAHRRTSPRTDRAASRATHRQRPLGW